MYLLFWPTVYIWFTNLQNMHRAFCTRCASSSFACFISMVVVLFISNGSCNWVIWWGVFLIICERRNTVTACGHPISSGGRSLCVQSPKQVSHSDCNPQCSCFCVKILLRALKQVVMVMQGVVLTAPDTPQMMTAKSLFVRMKGFSSNVLYFCDHMLP